MAAKGSGESKTGLVVALVIFILLTLILGTTTYYGYQAAEVADKGKKDADAKAQDADKLADWYRGALLITRSYVDNGPREEKDALEALSVLRQGYSSNSGKGAVHSKDPQGKSNSAFLARLDKEYDWDVARNAPKKTMQDKMLELQNAVNAAKASAGVLQDKNTEQERDLAAKERQLKKANDDYTKGLAEARKASDDSQEKWKVQTTTAQTEVEKVKTQWDNEKKAWDAERARLTAVVEATNKLITSMRKSSNEGVFLVRSELGAELKRVETELEKSGGYKLPKLAERVAREDRLKDLQPAGTVTQMDRTGGNPWIDLGTAHGLKAGVTFSVHGKGPDGKPLKDKKASLEVVRVVGPRSAQTRLTEVRDEGRDPVTPGDFLINVAWKPNQRMQIAIAGIIDLTGDGRDGTAEFRRHMAAQNVDIVAHLDFKEYKMVGQMDGRTDYLVVGFAPDADYVPKKADDARADAATKAQAAITAMREQATKDGVQIITIKDFLALTGYRVARPLGDAGAGFGRPGASGLGSPPERRDVPKVGK